MKAGLPLKTDDDDDDGLYTDDQLHSMLGDLYSLVHMSHFCTCPAFVDRHFLDSSSWKLTRHTS